MPPGLSFRAIYLRAPLAFYQLICNCFIVLCRFLTATGKQLLLCSFSHRGPCSYMYIQKEILHRLIFSRHDSHCIRDVASLNLSILIGTQFARDCQPESLFSFRLFSFCVSFCLRDNLLLLEQHMN